MFIFPGKSQFSRISLGKTFTVSEFMVSIEKFAAVQSSLSLLGEKNSSKIEIGTGFRGGDGK